MTQQPATLDRGPDRAIILFFVLAYAIAWGAFAIVAAIARGVDGVDAVALLGIGETLQFGGVDPGVPGWLLYLLTRLADFAFSIAGIVMIAVTSGAAGLRLLWQRLTHWRFSWVWYAAGLVPILLYLVALGVSGAVGSADFSASTVSRALFSLEAGLLVSLFLRGAFGEEFGLRGFALPRLQLRHGPFRASLIIGALWGAWHLPVLLGRDVVSIVAFLLLSFGLSFLFTWLFNGSGGSLIPGLLFHATQNWEEGFETFFPALVGTDWELVSTLSLLLLGVVAVFLVRRMQAVP